MHIDIFSNTETLEQGASLGKERRRLREKRIEKASCQGPVYRVESIGSGWEYPHRASGADMAAEIRFRAGLDSGMALEF